jgi:hypothetical protein
MGGDGVGGFADRASPMTVKYFTFNTPIGTMPEKQCGRGVMSDIHVSEAAVTGVSVPSGCDFETADRSREGPHPPLLRSRGVCHPRRQTAGAA